LLNLLGNAVKFTDQGEVHLRVEFVPGETLSILRFEVADTGIGVEPDKLARLFEPFVQGDASITRRFGGTGLGLAISQRLAQALGGRITAQSSPGQGSKFCLEIDLGPAACGPAATTTWPSPSPGSSYSTWWRDMGRCTVRSG
jgi:signal transduction histidine kinase